MIFGTTSGSWKLILVNTSTFPRDPSHTVRPSDGDKMCLLMISNLSFHDLEARRILYVVEFDPNAAIGNDGAHFVP